MATAPSSRLLTALAVRRSGERTIGRRALTASPAATSSPAASYSSLVVASSVIGRGGHGGVTRARTATRTFCRLPTSTTTGTPMVALQQLGLFRRCGAQDNNNQHVSSCLFSSAAPSSRRADEDDQGGSPPGTGLVSLPPNLKIDPRSTCSPFHGMERVQQRVEGGVAEAVLEEEEEEEDEGTADSELYAGDAAAAAETRDDEEEQLVGEPNDDEDEEGDDLDDDDDDVEYDEGGTAEEWFDASTRPEPYRAIPLPDRLHVPVHHLPTHTEAGSIHLSPEVFGLDPIRPDLIHRVVIYQRNKKRGKRKAKTKTIGEVRGSTRKVRQQKGLGKARAGHSRPAHWRGGAKAHGPKGSIQDYTTKLNKKVRKLGLRHALSQKLKEGNLVLLTDLVLETHKTKALARLLDEFDIGGRYGASAFVVDHAESDEKDGQATCRSAVGGVNVNFMVASGNLHKVKVVNQLGANVYDILKHEKLVLTLGAVTALEGRLGG